MKQNILLAVFLFLCLIFIGYTAYGQTASNVKSLLSSEGKVLFGDEPNSILVIDYPENIKKVEEYLKMVDLPPQQVLIEARIVEVKLQGENSLGINWQLFAEKGGTKMGQFRVGSTSGGALEQNIPYRATYYPPGSTQTTDVETPFTLTIFDENINVVLSALANSFDTNILSAPRVTTVNNHQAEIKVIRELRWVVPTLQVEDTGGTTLTWSEAEGSPRDVGILLKVTPMITGDGKISMELEPEVSEHVKDLQLQAVAGTTIIDYTIPLVDTRKATTKVVIGNMQTLIIGGMIKEKNTKGMSKIPFLGDIPGIGWLFKSQKDTKEKSELLIFVSPTIISSEVTMQMKRKETVDIGKWYMRAREAEEKALKDAEQKMEIKKADDDFSSRLKSLDKEVLNLEKKSNEKK